MEHLQVEDTTVQPPPAYLLDPPQAIDGRGVPQPRAAHSTAPPGTPENSSRAALPRRYPHPLPARDGLRQYSAGCNSRLHHPSSQNKNQKSPGSDPAPTAKLNSCPNILHTNSP